MTLRELNATISNTINIFTKCKEKVLRKFLVDMVKGIIISRSINVAEISRAIKRLSKTDSKHIFKRLDRNIGNLDTEIAKEKAQARQINLIDDETLIYFDPTEVVKKYGKKFEALGKVADGSDDNKIKPGYRVNACIAMKNDEIIPIEFVPYSYTEEAFESENLEVLKPIETIAHKSKFKGKFVLDRAFDSFAIIRHLDELGVNFIIRMKENRMYYHKFNRTQSYDRYEIIERFAEITSSAWIDIRIKKKRLVRKRFIIKATSVGLLGGIIDSLRPLTLIKAKAADKLTLYLLTNIEEISSESIVHIVQYYLGRWKIEEFIRFIKDTYKAERFRVRDLGRIRNLFNMLYIAVVVLTRVSELDLKFSKIRAIVIKYSERVCKTPQKMKFFLYTLARGLSKILKILDRKLIQLFEYKPKNQLTFNFHGIW